MTTTDGRARAGGSPDPPRSSARDEPDGAADRSTGEPVAPSARNPEPDGGPAVARVRRPRPAPGTGSAGRHARTDEPTRTGHTPPPGYRPRHAAPESDTEQIAASPQRGPRGSPTPAAPDPGAIAPTPVQGLPLASTFPSSAVTASEDVPMPEAKKPIFGWSEDAAPAPAGDDAEGEQPERVRIVLSERRSPTRAVGTVAEIEAQTATGELLLSNLMRSQLTLALRLAAVAVLALGVLPVVFLTMPAISDATPVLGIGLPWLVLGGLFFPFLLVLGWLYTRHAERNELDFADDVED